MKDFKNLQLTKETVELLEELSLAFSSVKIQLTQIGMKVSDIEISKEHYKNIDIEYRPQNVTGTQIFLTADYCELMADKIDSILLEKYQKERI